jgi:hypothetical protein
MLKREPTGINDTVICHMDHEELEGFQTLSPGDQKKRLGPNGYLLTEVSDLALRQAAQAFHRA